MHHNENQPSKKSKLLVSDLKASWRNCDFDKHWFLDNPLDEKMNADAYCLYAYVKYLLMIIYNFKLKTAKISRGFS